MTIPPTPFAGAAEPGASSLPEGTTGAGGECRLTVNIVVHNRLDMTRRCLNTLLANTDEPLTIQIIDNASTDGTWSYLRRMATRHSNIHVFRKRRNEGFPGRQNELALRTKTPYLCVLNNDVEVGWAWQRPLIEALQSNPLVGIAGPSGLSIEPQYGGGWTGRAEYIEGWCFVMPKAVVDRFGLFDQGYQFAYYEDTDLSLRLQEAGLQITAVQAPVAHIRSATRTVCKEDVTGFEVRNRLVFQKRWKHYLKRREFRYRFKIIRPGAHGDVLMMTPALRGLRRKWPSAFIAVETRCPEVLMHNPSIDLILPLGGDWSEDWDEIWDLTGVTERRLDRSPMYIYCEALDVNPEVMRGTGQGGEGVNLRPEFFLTQWDREQTQPLMPSEPYAVLHTGRTWPTKAWLPERFRELGLRLQAELGLRVVEVGDGDTDPLWIDYNLSGRLTWQGLGALLERAAVFVGVDSGPAHVAQAVGTPSVVLFGPTAPELLWHPHAPGRAVRAAGLECLGCYHLHPPGAEFAICYRGDHACMRSVTVDQVLTDVKGMCRGNG
jgi:ADP-heptose:LPS heptosyltransferase